MTTIRTTAVYDGQIEYTGEYELDPATAFGVDQVLLTDRLAILTLTFDDGSVLIYEKES